MKITLNNRVESFDKEQMTVAQIMEAKSFRFRMLVVRLNDNIVKKDKYGETLVKEGDDLKIIHLVSGG
ncbi:MAG: sulfur carrier protein ThiS [Bacteroidales bacterium]|jgi:thiamine biosynthesis protein ThiS|nr:sulfur carrier protein ThiS [Bacteroidales bacterium]MDD3843994.1 sulfur carrier protein ThiS [Bacteroidales bacterium]MDD4619194.1 sulfur carrier protein ThiS [Bacteroidales bacterium]